MREALSATEYGGLRSHFQLPSAFRQNLNSNSLRTNAKNHNDNKMSPESPSHDINLASYRDVVIEIPSDPVSTPPLEKDDSVQHSDLKLNLLADESSPKGGEAEEDEVNNINKKIVELMSKEDALLYLGYDEAMYGVAEGFSYTVSNATRLFLPNVLRNNAAQYLVFSMCAACY